MRHWLERGGAALRNLTPRWARIAAFLAGATSALGFAPFGITPFLLAGFAVVVLLLDGAHLRPRPLRESAWIGWAFGFGQFLVGLHWIGYAFMVDPGAHEWQIPFVALLFPGGLAIFVAVACAAAARFWTAGAARIFAFTAALAFAEWLRGNVLTGFPWNLAGYGWGSSLAVMQCVSVIGIYGLTFLTILFGASLAMLSEPRHGRRLPALIAILFGAMFAGGALRLSANPPKTVHGVRLRIVQPNIPQTEKDDPALAMRNWRRLIDLSTAPAAQRPTHIIWPEAAPPFLLTRVPEAMDQIALLTDRNRVLLTGALRAEQTADGVRYFNSFYVFGSGGRLLETYDKFHLVPFGEYLPFEGFLKRFGLTKIVGIAGSFATGDGPHRLAIPGAPAAGPLICYEILFPGEVVGRQRPDWFVNVTDDSWFGPWAGPRQHFLVAQTRAIEEGIPVVRAANTGISAVIDPFGRLDAKSELNKMEVLDSELPVEIAPTIYARFEQSLFWLFFFGSLVVQYCLCTIVARRRAIAN